MNIRKLSEEQYAALPDSKIPRCRVTGDRLTLQQLRNSGHFKNALLKKLFKDLGSAEAVIGKIKSDYLYCPVDDCYYDDFRAARTSLVKRGYPEEVVRKFYEDCVQSKTTCRFPGCTSHVPIEMTHFGCCTITHYNQSQAISKGRQNMEDMKFVCTLDGMWFKKVESIGNHLRRNYNYTDQQVEEYYRTYVMKPGDHPGTCLWCSKPVPFGGIGLGYDKFCADTSCCVLWNNEHTGRAKRAGPAIKKSHARGDVIPTQLGYWTKRGHSLEEAKVLRKKMHGGNSVEAIMARDGVDRPTAEAFRSSITTKWLNSMPRMNWSIVSQKLFWEIRSRMGENLPTMYFATLSPDGSRDDTRNQEFRLTCKDGKSVLIDFYIPSLNLAIEFDGSYWHSGRFKGTKPTNEARDARIAETLPGIRLLHVSEIKNIGYHASAVEQCLEFIKNAPTV